MKSEDARQRKKEGRTKNGERSKHKAKNKSKQNDRKLGTRECEDVPLVPEKPPAEPKVVMAKLGEESAKAIGLQVVFPYLLAGLGMVMAGMVLDIVQVVFPYLLAGLGMVMAGMVLDIVQGPKPVFYMACESCKCGKTS